MAFLELQEVCKGYGDDACGVLRDVDLAIAKGELVAVVGRSGAGKSTLLSMIAGLIAPSRGELRLDGKRITRPGTDRAVVFQSYALLPWLTVHGNIRLAVDQIHDGWSKAQRDDRTDQLIALVNLTPARDKRPPELSGGMRQRVAVARALAMEPEVLLMDEPLAALDAMTRGVLQDEIARICAGKTALLVTNDVDEAIRLADRIVPLRRSPMGGATLCASIPVTLPKPRDRRALANDHHALMLRAEVIARLRADEPVRSAPAYPLPVAAEVAA